MTTPLSLLVPFGNLLFADQVIVDYLGENHHDLVILGHRGMSNIQALLLGSVAYKVVNYAPCAVLIVK